MADVLAAYRRLALDRPSRGRRRHPVQHLLGAREGAGARVPRSRPRARAQGARSPTSSSASAAASRARRAPASSGAPPMSTSCSARRRCIGCPQLIRARRATGTPQVDVSFPEIEKFDHLPPPRVDGAVGVRVDHGGLQQVLHVLRRAVHARRGSLAAVRRRADRGRRPRRPGRHGNHAARPERQRLSRADGRRRRNGRPRDAARIRRRDSRHRAHPLHDVASEGDDAAAHRRVRHASASSSRTCTCPCNRAPTACSRR